MRSIPLIFSGERQRRNRSSASMREEQRRRRWGNSESRVTRQPLTSRQTTGPEMDGRLAPLYHPDLIQSVKMIVCFCLDEILKTVRLIFFFSSIITCEPFPTAQDTGRVQELDPANRCRSHDRSGTDMISKTLLVADLTV